MANFYNIYNPAQGTANGLLGLPEFTNPVQFICANFDAGGTTDNLKRTEICRQRMAPVLRRLAMNYSAHHVAWDQHDHRVQGPGHL